mgnify:CR=1 FL=1
MKNRRGFGQSYGYYIDICGCFSETGGILFFIENARADSAFQFSDNTVMIYFLK